MQLHADRDTGHLSPAIVIPAFNEAGSVGDVVRAVRSIYPYPVIVVDDGSSDTTRQEAASAGAIVLPLAINLGAWGATQAGMRYAVRSGHQLVITLDADGQHEPRQIARLIDPIIAGSAEVVIGACADRCSKLRRFAWQLLAATFGLRFEDLTSGFRAYGREALKVLCGSRATYLDYQDVGVLALLQAHGLRIADVQVPMAPRRNGYSRIFRSWFLVAVYMCHTLLLGVAKRPLGRSQRRVSDFSFNQQDDC